MNGHRPATVDAHISSETRLELLLENWGRWARWGLNNDLPDWPKSCSSIESRYPIPKWPGDEDPPAPPNERLGELVEAAWRVLLLPHRQVLCATYVTWPWSRVRLCCEIIGCDATVDRADNYRSRECRMPGQLYLAHLERSRPAMSRAIEAMPELSKGKPVDKLSKTGRLSGQGCA